MFGPHKTVFIKLLATIAVSACLTGLTYNNGALVWYFADTLTWTTSPGTGSFDSSGIPWPKATNPVNGVMYNGFANVSSSKVQSFLNYLNATLPEYVSQKNNTVLITSNDDAYNIYLDQNATVEITFISEGAGYRNSMGYFAYDPLNPPTKKTDLTGERKEKLIFPNTSFFNSGGSTNGLRTGDTVSLGPINLSQYSWNSGKNCSVAGNCRLALGFFVVADGWVGYLAGSGPIKSTINTDWIFYSLRALNSEVTTTTFPTLNAHTVLLKDPVSGIIGFAFEDIFRTGGDHDFNDVVYRVKVTPESAITNMASIYQNRIPDADGDGVADSLDEFPTDPERASSSWYPSKTGWNTLAYEDLWPSKGDYDMNDLVLNYRYRQILKADGTVKEIEVQYLLRATGANDHDGFGLELTGIPAATRLDYARLQKDSNTAVSVTPATTVLGRSVPNLMFKIFDSARTEFGESLVNTVRGRTGKALITYKFNVAFTTPVAKTAFTYAPPYNPFLFRTTDPTTLEPQQKFIEVHLPGYAPTGAATPTLFGTADDNTSLAARRYYVSTLGHPWALNIAADWKWPLEGTDILKAYPNFKAWAESGGVSSSTWYLSPASAYLY